MREPDSIMLKGVSTHHWLKHPGDSSYHAYLKIKQGMAPVCEAGPTIDNWSTMDIPGDQSPCCNSCFAKLYGVDLRGSTPPISEKT